MKKIKRIMAAALTAVTVFSVFVPVSSVNASEIKQKTLYLGDIDRDGRIGADDARSALRISVALKECDAVMLYYGDYIGDGKIVHAANARKGITISPYTYMTPYKARRVVG